MAWLLLLWMALWKSEGGREEAVVIARKKALKWSMSWVLRFCERPGPLLGEGWQDAFLDWAECSGRLPSCL